MTRHGHWTDIGRPRPQPCADCGIDTSRACGIGEYYMVHHDVWTEACGLYARAEGIFFLCIGCLETRLCRTLTADDFTGAYANTAPMLTRSARLQDRLSR